MTKNVYQNRLNFEYQFRSRFLEVGDIALPLGVSLEGREATTSGKSSTSGRFCRLVTETLVYIVVFIF